MSTAQHQRHDEPSSRGAGLSDEAEILVAQLARPPVPWTLLMLLVAVVAAVNVSRSPAGTYAINFEVDAVSLIALSLIWLPLLVRVFALVGGSLKAAGMEASVPGMLSQSDAIAISVQARQVASAGDDTERRLAAHELEESVNRLASTEPGVPALDETVLRQLALEYERLRRTLPPGNRRTSAMTRIVNEARTRAALAPQHAQQHARNLLASARPGDRIVGLGLAQETADARSFEAVLRLVCNSASAFEMFHALIALQEMSMGLTPKQRRSARLALEEEQNDPRAVGIHSDPGLPHLLARTIGILQGAE